jgi:hypothetical protein
MAQHVIAPHYVNDCQFVVSGRVVHLHSQFDRLLSARQTLGELLHIGQQKLKK